MKNAYFISVDWGTTNLRIRLVSLPFLDIIEEIVSPKGVKTVYQEWTTQQGQGKEAFFLHFLKSQIQQLKTTITPSVIVVVSGMASSTIGLRELPYSALPFPTDGRDLHVEKVESADFPYSLFLISGVKSDSDVIRGEEVQMVGLYEKEDEARSVIFILPGTHSKHIVCEKGVVIDFKTFMTGEIFEVMSSHTILTPSLDKGILGEAELLAFEQAVLESQTGHSLLNSFFQIRTNTLFGKKTTVENYFFLSGLLIGEEIRTLVTSPCDTIKLCAGDALFHLYFKALNVFGLSSKTQVVSQKMVDTSVIRGQWQVINKTVKKPFR